MKYYETNFEEYIQSSIKNPLHIKNHNIGYNNIHEFNNLILYGPPGVGKYTQILTILEKLSPSNLKYEKKMVITYNKNIFNYKISDIHYEIDM